MLRRLRYTSLLIQFILCAPACSNSDDQSGSASISIKSIATLGGSNNERGLAVVATSDGGFATLGFTQSNDGAVTDKNDESFDYWVLK